MSDNPPMPMGRLNCNLGAMMKLLKVNGLLLGLLLATGLAVGAQTPAKVADDYVIGPGDSLQIFVWRNPELSVTVPVRPDGKISTPLVENMVAVGKSPSILARDMEKVLAEFVRSPQVNVIVGTAISTFSQVKVVGQVRVPQGLPYREGLRVLDIVLASGGLTEFAAPNRARVVRQVNGKEVVVKVKLGDLLNKGDLKQNHLLQPGDVLIIPQSMF
jgi:polysaccharide export outer membrane protein